MGVPFLDQGPMRVEEFYAFTDTRPDEEKWELIDGEPLLNPTPSYLHQKIVRNLLVLLDDAARQSRGGWEVLPGLGVRLSDTSVPVPDVLIRPDKFIDGRDCDDMIVAFEVLSPSTAKRDLRWKRTAYASLPTLRQYVVLAQDAVDILSFDREAGAGDFSERRFTHGDEELDLPAIGVRARLSEIYRGLGLAGA
jgi:Uma2 family endonuclease